MWSLHFNARPFLNPVCHAFHIRLLVQSHPAQLVAGLTTLVEHYSVVPIFGIAPYPYSHLLARPARATAGTIRAFERAHDVSRVFVVGLLLVGSFTKPRRVDRVRDFFCNVLME